MLISIVFETCSESCFAPVPERLYQQLLSYSGRPWRIIW